jgi:hypothetical protein
MRRWNDCWPWHRGTSGWVSYSQEQSRRAEERKAKGKPMKPAIQERLNDLATIAQWLRAILDAETPGNPLPPFALCRLAIDVDNVVGQMERHAERLTVAASTEQR